MVTGLQSELVVKEKLNGLLRGGEVLVISFSAGEGGLHSTDSRRKSSRQLSSSNTVLQLRISASFMSFHFEFSLVALIPVMAESYSDGGGIWICFLNLFRHSRSARISYVHIYNKKKIQMKVLHLYPTLNSVNKPLYFHEFGYLHEPPVLWFSLWCVAPVFTNARSCGIPWRRRRRNSLYRTVNNNLEM